MMDRLRFVRGARDAGLASSEPVMPAIQGRQVSASGWGRADAVKRGIDVVTAIALLVLTLPLTAIVALAIVVESRGPVFYRAERVGRGGRTMRMLKFRKMHRDARGLNLTARADQRLTRVGAVLVRTRLDELPQLINVVRGEMSMVGPRPEDPAFVVARPGDYDEILRVRPGITGLAQLAFADERHILSPVDPVRDYLERIFPQKCSLDRLYVERGDLAMDLRILFWTVVVVLLRRPVAVDRKSGSIRRRHRPNAFDDTTPVLGK